MIYIAAPFFISYQINVIKRIEESLNYAGLRFYSPRKDGIIKEDKSLDLTEVYNRNISKISESDYLVAVIDGRDTGTSFEIGYAACAGIKIITMSLQDHDVNVMIAKSTICHVKSIPKLISALQGKDIIGDDTGEVY